MNKSTISILSCLIALLTFGLTTSCKGDDEENDGINCIITGQPSAVGITYAVLTGEFYPDQIPSSYISPYFSLSLGIELSVSEAFKDGEVYPVYARGVEGNRMEVHLRGLNPDTKYYYRAFIDAGTMKLYGEKQTFTTLAMQFACNVGDATDISYTTATFKVNFNASALPSTSEDISYGVAYTTDKSLLSNTQLGNNDLTGVVLQPVMYSSDDITLAVDDLYPGKTYYYCTYASGIGNRVCQFGLVKSFTTKSVDELLAIDNISAKFVVAEITAHTYFSESIKGLRYIFNYSMIDVSNASPYEFVMSVDGSNLTAVIQHLSPSHRYECWISVVQNGRTIAQSEKKEFNTLNPGDYILLDDATEITSTSAVINCTLSPFAYEDEKMAFINYGQDKYNLIRSETATLNGDHLTARLNNLLPNTTYYYCAQALCILGFGYGDWFNSEIKSFKTPASNP